MDVVQEYHEPFTLLQPCIDSYQGPMLPQTEKHGHERVPLFTTLSLEDVYILTHLILPQIS